MTRDEWKAICTDMKQRAARRRMIHVSTAIGQDATGRVKRVGFQYRLTPEARAAKLAPQKGRRRRLARAAARLAQGGEVA